MSRTRDPRLELQRKEQVLDATIALLGEGSWHGTSLAAVAARAGVSKGVVTYWFPDKDALILGAIDRYHAQVGERLAAVAAGDGAIEERLARLLEVGFPDVDSVVREIAFQAEVLSYAKSRPDAAARVRDAYNAFRQLTGALVQLGVIEGYVVEPHPELHRFVHALIDGLSFQVAADPDVDLPALRAALQVHLEVWFRGRVGRCS